MYASRTAARAAARSARAPLRASARQLRFQSTQSEAAKTGASSGLVGGLVGGGLVFAAGYGYYHFSGAKKIVNTASATKAQLDNITKSIQNNAPAPNEALKWLRSTAQSYAAFIPGAKSYVDSAFNDLDAVQAKHGGEVEKIVQNAYAELKDATKSGMTMETASRSWAILEKYMNQLGELASDSASEILDNHPELKEKVGGNLDQLKQMAGSYGPEAKKELDQTYQQIKDVIAGGVSVETISKVKQLIQEKTDKVKSLGDEAWKKGLEQAKPYLEKNPQIKELIEKNADSLKQGNVGDLFEQVKSAVSSGNSDQLQQFINQAGEKAKKSGLGQGIEQYAKMIPGGGEILPKLQKLQEVAKQHGEEAEKILKDTVADIQGVLQKRMGQVEDLAKKAGKNAKS